MTNREIGLELAKTALNNIGFMNIDTVKQFYDWIVEEPEVEVETEQKKDFDNIHIKEVLNIVRKNQLSGSGIGTTLETIFNDDEIYTVGDLTRIGRRSFLMRRTVGKKSILAIDDALAELGVTTW